MQPTYKELFAQNEELFAQNEELFAQNKEFFAQNKEFLAQNQSLMNLNQILTQQLEEALLGIQQVQKLKDEILQLKEEIKDLKDKHNTNSSNSSKPPSQDPFRKGKKNRSSGRKQGGQNGHPGHSRSLAPSEEVQITHELKPNVCPECQSNSFDLEIIGTEVRQVLELPEMPPEVTQYNIHTCRCSFCGKHVRADIPNEAKYGFGPRLMGFITSLSGEFRLSKRQVVALVGKIGIRMSSGSVCKIHARASQILKEPFEEIKKYTLEQPHLNADETSWKTIAIKRWVWIGCCKDSVFFEIKTSRSARAFQEVFGTYKGGLTTDRYNGYNTHQGERQTCWAHADRDFEKIASREGFDKIVGEELLKCKEMVFNLWHNYKDGQIAKDELIRRIEEGPKEDIKLWFKIGAAHEDCHNKTKATCMDFYRRFDSLWLFVYKENIEPTNNAAEQGLRHGVIWRKLSFGSQSEIGERFVERVMTVSETLKRRAKNSFDYFTRCFRELIRGGYSPPIFAD
jgi:transposase